MRQQQLNLWGWMVVVLGLVPCAGALRAQELSQDMTNRTEAAEEAAPVEYEGRHYNIRVGSGGLNFSAGLQLRYVDNVFLANTGRRNDYIIQPVGDVAAYFPIGVSNALTLDVGITYYQYTQNRELNTGTPIINPNSELAFNIKAGDFTIRPSEAFSYQESPVYETGSAFINVENTGRLARYDNVAGVGVKWDLNDIVADAAYYHENLWANGSEFNYLNHVSELLNADVMFAVSPRLKVGVETWGSLNTFEFQTIRNSWRVRGGPALRWEPSQFIQGRLGGGYERIDYNSGAAAAEGIEPLNTFYGYGRVDHQLTRFISHALEGGYDNQLGYNAGNLSRYYILYLLNWQATQRLKLSPLGSVGFYREAFGTSIPGLYDEQFTYVLGGVTAAYDLGRHWQASVSWAYRLKESGTPGLGYSQNQAALQLLYAF